MHACIGASDERAGAAKAPVTIREAEDASTLEGERKTITALFADIKGLTELEQDLDPEDHTRRSRMG
jgi:class 3 adenylate cyclase